MILSDVGVRRLSVGGERRRPRQRIREPVHGCLVLLVATGTLTAVAAAIPDLLTDMLIPALAIGPLHHLRPADDQSLDLPRGHQLRLGLRGGQTIGREDLLVHAVGLPSMMLR